MGALQGGAAHCSSAISVGVNGNKVQGRQDRESGTKYTAIIDSGAFWWCFFCIRHHLAFCV